MTLPASVLEQHIAILGKTGSGKSNLAKTLAERLIADHARVCILDPTSTWWGLRLARDGVAPSGLEPVIFGGDRADIAIAPEHGAAIGEAVGTSDGSSIIDTRLMTVGGRTAFFTGFAEALLRANRGPLHLIIDEAHVFMPQGRVADPKSGAMLHAGNNLVSLGRSSGLRIVMISQRPAKLHKDSLSQAETLIAMKLIAPQDRRAVEDWVGEWADPGKGREISAALPSLARGDAWVWAPEIGMLELVHFPLASTFDSGSAQAREAGALPPIDAAAIGARLEAIRAEVVANDPARLRKRIAELEKQVERGSGCEEIEKARKAGYDAGYAEGHREGRDIGGRQASHAQIIRVVDGLVGAAMLVGDGDALQAALERMRAIKFGPDELRKAAEPAAEQPAAIPPARATESEKPAILSTEPGSLPLIEPKPLSVGAPAAGLTGAQQRALDAIAWWHAIGFDEVHRERAAVTCGLSPKASTFGVYLSQLSRLGLVEAGSPKCIRLTPAGKAAATVHRADPGAVAGMAAALLSPQAARVFALLREAWPEPMRRDDLADRMGLSRTASTLGVYISQCSRYGFVEPAGKGEVKAADWLFPGRA